jgi:glycosyltransferase involved in cell wall biosynthesis
MSRKRAFVYALCGNASYVRMLHRSLEYLRPRTTLPVIVVTDTRRNEIAIDHPTVIDVETPRHFSDHQASIFLKTGLHQFLPPDHEYAYLDTDVIAIADGVDLIFGHQLGPVTFAHDFTFLEECVATFSPWAVNCSCLEDRSFGCSHLSQAIERKFGVSVPDDWVNWNGGVFLFGPDALQFMETWHNLTLQIFEDPYWRIRDQGTLIATVWKLGLERQPCLPPEYNFILALSNPELHFDRATGYSLHESLSGIHPTFLHIIRAGLDRPDWSLARDIEDVLEERSRHAAGRSTPSDPIRTLSVVADRLAPRTSAPSLVARPKVEYRVIVGRPRWSLSGESVLAETLVRGLQKRGVDARVLLTEENTDRVSGSSDLLPRPADVAFDLLPASPEASWGGRWGTLIRYLEERAPCVYLPTADWRNSNVSARLSGRVAIVGIVHNGDPRHYEQVERLGRYWNAIVSPSAEIATRVAELRPELASRIVRIAPGVDVPSGPLQGIIQVDGLLRIVYHGRLAHRQKRIFDLQSIVEALLARGVPVQLTLIGDGPDRHQLMTASQPLVEKGVLRWLGVLPHDQVLEELQRHDVCLLTSGFDGLPQAVTEAMARGCVPVVGDTAGLSELVLDDINGYRVPVGDLEGFWRRLEMLHREPGRRRHLSRTAQRTVIERGFHSDRMVEKYAATFAKVMAESARGDFHRPEGLLRKPPYQVAGMEVFPVHYFRGIEKVGVFPSYREDYEDYRNAVGESRTAQLPAWRRELVNPYPAIIAAPVMASATNTGFVAALAQGLQRHGQPVQVLVTPGASPDSDSLRCGEGVQVLRTPIGKAPWRPRYQALADYLESQSPCLYLPSHEWLHRSVCPLLSDRIGVIGRVDDPDPQNLGRAAQMGAHCNVIVAGSLEIAERLIQANPGLSSRVVTIPLPIDVPKRLADRPLVWDAPLRVAHWNAVGPTEVAATLERIVAALMDHGLPIERTAVEEGAGSGIFERADVCVVLSESESDRIRLLEAMGRGCIPVVARGNGILAELVKDGENGYVLPDNDIRGFAARLRALQGNPALRRVISVKAFVSARALETVDVFVASYSMLFERVLRDVDEGVHRRCPAHSIG